MLSWKNYWCAAHNALELAKSDDRPGKGERTSPHATPRHPAGPAGQVPLPLAGLPARRVLVMDYVEGTPLNRLGDEMEKRGIKPGSPESKLAGRRILQQLSDAFGRMMLGAGFIHGDPVRRQAAGGRK